MSTAIASAAPAPLPSIDHREPSPRTYPTIAPLTSAPSFERISDSANNSAHHTPAATPVERPYQRTPPEGKRSPKSSRNSGVGAAKPIIKKEPPTSPSLQANNRHRPRKLDLTGNSASVPPPLNSTSRPSGGLLSARDGYVMHDVGLACLSPGFQTHDPAMREQLQRSISVRDQQRSIIESRLLKTSKGEGPNGEKQSEAANPFGKPPPSSNKKRPPPGLSIVPPAAEHFANERVIQSAPLNQTFTGRNQPPMTRQVMNQPSNLANTSHIHHVPAIQTSNRLPPIADVFGSETLNPPSARPQFHQPQSESSSSQSMHRPPLPSPGMPPDVYHGNVGPPPRPREYRSAEEAVHEMSGGREELLPKIVHYRGHQPPTPPSPQQMQYGLTPNKYAGPQHEYYSGGSTSHRRSRHEYEGDSSPPLGTGREQAPHGPFGAGRDSPNTQQAKKSEFLALCSRAWDLFHD